MSKSRIDKTIKNKYFEFTPVWSGFNITYHIAGYFDPRPQLQIYLFWVQLFIYLPWRHYKKVEIKKSEKENRKDKLDIISNPKKKIEKKYTKELYDQSQTRNYGCYFMEHMFVIQYGHKNKYFDMPWKYQWVRTSCLAADKISWYHDVGKHDQEFYDKERWKGKIFSETHPYKYTTKYGEEQYCLATIIVKEREWRCKWFTWSKYPRLLMKDIEVEFSDDIGEKKGTWKGGTTGCSYQIRKNESPYDTLKRMEKERKF